MVESSDVAFQNFQAGDLDYVDLTESALTTIARDPNNEYYDYLVPASPVQILLPDALQLQQEQ